MARTADQPGQEQLYVFTIARMLTAAYLVFGGVAALRGRRPRHPYLVIGASVVVMLGAIAWVNAPGADATVERDPGHLPVGPGDRPFGPIHRDRALWPAWSMTFVTPLPERISPQLIVSRSGRAGARHRGGVR